MQRGQVKIVTREGGVVEVKTMPCEHQCSEALDHKVGDVANWGRWGATHVGPLRLERIDEDGLQHWVPEN